MKALDDGVYKEMFASLPMGALLLDKSGVIREWNQWLALQTGVTHKKAKGRLLQDLFSSLVVERFHFALEQVVEHQHPQILSQILNRYLIPIPLKQETSSEVGNEYMQQSVSLSPIVFRDAVYALVVIVDVTQNHYQRQMLMNVAKRFEKESVHDELTGLYNRRFLWEHLQSALPKASREQYTVVCTVYDLDCFKAVNDELGHKAGDEVLLSFVDVLKKTLRVGDKVFRYGGEEFITISSHVDVRCASALATRVCQAMRVKKQHGTVMRKVTCSAGFSIAMPRFSVVMEASVLVKQADEALYLAKETGRDRVCGYDEMHLVDFNHVVSDNAALQQEFYTVFLEEATPYGKRLEKAFLTQDIETLVSVTHPLKTAAKTVGATVLATHAEQLEVAARAGDDVAINHLQQDFMRIFNHTLQAITRHLTQV